MNRIIVIIVALVVTIPTVLKGRLSVHYPAPPAFFVYSYPSSGTTVMIEGDVRHPGVYVVGANIVTDGAIALAEPVRRPEVWEPEGAGKLPLASGSFAYVTQKPNNSAVITVGSIPTAQRMILGIPLDIHSMNTADFDRLPGIGPVLADRIVKYRQFNGGRLKPLDLLSVSGIGEKKYNVLKKYF
jgi:competence protein ComEA